VLTKYAFVNYSVRKNIKRRGDQCQRRVCEGLSSTPYERNICNSRMVTSIAAPTLVQVTTGGAGKQSDGVAKNRFDYFEAFADRFRSAGEIDN
jgi:hypothetical protein